MLLLGNYTTGWFVHPNFPTIDKISWDVSKDFYKNISHVISLQKKTTSKNVWEFVKALLKFLGMLFDKSIDRVWSLHIGV